MPADDRGCLRRRALRRIPVTGELVPCAEEGDLFLFHVPQIPHSSCAVAAARRRTYVLMRLRAAGLRAPFPLTVRAGTTRARRGSPATDVSVAVKKTCSGR